MRQVSVIISTYNSPLWLQKVLYGYQNQLYRDFEVVIADDGSTDATRKMIEAMRKEVSYPIRHVWHEDKGFRKCVVLNKAITEVATDYLLLTDGDCVPRKDFLACHMKHRQPGYFLSGGYCKLPMAISEAITKSDIDSGRAFDVKWLCANGLPKTFKNTKFTAGAVGSKILNLLTPTKPSWNGHNASGWKTDILAVNGFDERMQYGGEDRELGERLMNLGIKSKQIRYSAIVVHLDHERGYVKEEMIKKNLEIRRETKNNRKTWTDYGIKKKSQK